MIDTEPLTDSEWSLLKPHLEPIWLIMYSLLWNTGLRVSEALNLTFEDLIINNEYKYIQVIRLKKKRKEYSKVLISDFLYFAMKKLESNERNRHIFKVGDKTLNRQQAHYVIRKASRLARFERDIHPHNFRHSYGKRLSELKTGMSALDQLHLVKEGLGLSSLQYAGRYSKPSKEQVEVFQRKLLES